MPVASGGKDGNGLKLKKENGRLFQLSCKSVLKTIAKILSWSTLLVAARWSVVSALDLRSGILGKLWYTIKYYTLNIFLYIRYRT